MEPTIVVALIGLAGICISAVVGPLIINYSNSKREKKEKKLESKKLKNTKRLRLTKL